MNNLISGWWVRSLTVVFGLLLAGVTILQQPRVGDALLWRLDSWSSKPSPLQRSHVNWHLAHLTDRAPHVPQGAIWLLGDSHLTSIPDLRMAKTTNFSVGGLTTRRLTAQLAAWPTLQTASVIVISVGTNDLLNGTSVELLTQDVSTLFAQLPERAKLICFQLPTGMHAVAPETQLTRVRSLLHDACTRRGNASTLEVSPATLGLPTIISADGIHLTREATDRVIRNLDALIATHTIR